MLKTIILQLLLQKPLTENK